MSSKQRLILLGASGHAKVIIEIIESLADKTVVGLLDKHKPAGEFFAGTSIVGDETLLPELIASDQVDAAVIAIGDNATRAQLAATLEELCPGFPFATLVHANATVSKSATLGAGTVVMAGAIVNADTVIGDHCIVNTNSSVDHDCKIADFCSIAPGACLGGNVTLGSASAVGLGANIIQSTTVGEKSLIAAGATVVTPIGSNVLAVGTPAREIRTRGPNEKSL